MAAGGPHFQTSITRLTKTCEVLKDYVHGGNRAEKEGEKMIPLKNPPGYPGDEAVRKAFGRAMRQASLECGLPIELAEVVIREGIRPDEARNKSTSLGRALGVFVRQLRERKGMTRIELASNSGLPLRFVILVERGKLTSGGDICQLTRLAFGLKYSVGQFFDELTDLDQDFAERMR